MRGNYASFRRAVPKRHEDLQRQLAWILPKRMAWMPFRNIRSFPQAMIM
jgi:hypothetical protein